MSSIRSASSRTRIADASSLTSPPLEQVLEPAGRGDEDVGLAGLLRLGRDRDPAVDRGDLEVVRRGDRLELGRDLRRELARRHEDQRRRTRVGRVELLDDRNRESECLPRARRRLREHVAAVEQVGEDERLDSERRMDVTLGESLRDAGRHAQLVERLHSVFSFGVSRDCLPRPPAISGRTRRSQTSQDGTLRPCGSR